MRNKILDLGIVPTRRNAVLKVTALGIAVSAVLVGQIMPPRKDKPILGLGLTLEASKHPYAAGEKIQLNSVLHYHGVQILSLQRGDSDIPLEFYHFDIESPTPPELPFSLRATMTKTGKAHHEQHSFSVRVLKMISGANYKMEFNDISDEYDMTQPGDY